MLRVLRRLLLLLCVAAIAGGALLTFTSRPKLETAHRDVVREWSHTRTRLTPRYALLDEIEAALRNSGRELTITDSIAAAHSKWAASTASAESAGSASASASVARQIEAANAIEGILRRAQLITDQSPRLSNNAALTKALGRVARILGDPAQIDTLNRSIDRANELRNGLLRRLVAGGLGYEDLPHFAGF